MAVWYIGGIESNLEMEAQEAAAYFECGLPWPPPATLYGAMRLEAAIRAAHHAERFRNVSDGYPARVAHAYGCDLAAAARDTYEQVGTKVRDWELNSEA